jgi:hypothetical protein
VVASFLHLLREMDSPYLGIGLLVLIMTGKIVVWEDDLDCWDGLPLDWALDGAFGEEALAIWDDMEEEFQPLYL